MANKLTVIRPESKPKEYNGDNHGVASKSDIIGRDAKEFLKRNPPVYDESEEVRIKFFNPCIKFFQALVRVDNNR